MNPPIIINISTPLSNINKLDVAGTLTVLHDITGHIELVVETVKCSPDMVKCDKYSTINIREMCKKFKDTNSFYSDVFRSINPPLICPLKQGNYTIGASTFHLERISMIPLDGYVWLITFKLVASDNGQKPKKFVLCLNSETKITKIRLAAASN